MRVTMLVRDTSGLKAKLRARTQEQKRRIIEASKANADEVYTVAQGLAVRDTSFSADRMRQEFTRNGFNYAVGWRRDDFIGQINPATGKEVTAFYIVYVLMGTRRMAGNDYLSAAQRLTRDSVKQRYIAALQV